MNKIYILILCLFSIQAFAFESSTPILEDDIEDVMNIKPDFEVYPNPAIGNDILISLKGIINNGGVYTITITNVIGQELYIHQVTEADITKGSFKINLEDNNIRKGLYFVKLVVGNETTIKKLMVK